MANEDFVVRFGSNADVFKARLKQDIVEVNGLVSQLRTALQTGAQMKIAADGRLGVGPGTDPTITRGGGGGGGGGGGKIDEHYANAVGKLVDNLETYNATLGGVIRAMDGASRLLEAAALAVKNRSSGKNRSQAAQDREANNAGKSNLPNVKKAHEEAIKAALDGAADNKDPFESHGNIRNVPRVEIDAAALDRIVANTKAGADAGVATNRKMDHLIGLINRGITVKGDGSGRSSGAGSTTRGTPAAPKGSAPEQDDAFSRVSQLRRQVQKREREQALFRELSRLQSGTGAAPSGEAFKTLSADSKSFKKIFAETGGQGEKYQARVQKAIDSTRAELADVPKLKVLRAQLAAAIDQTGTPDGRMPKAQRDAQRAADGKVKKPSTSAGAARAPEPGEDRNTRLQRQVQEALAVVKGYEVVVAGLSQAIDDVKSGKKNAPAGVDLQARLRKAEQDVAEAKALLAKAQRKAESTRAERKAENREQAAAVREAAGPQLSGRAARDRIDFLDVAGSTDALRQQSVKRLRELAATFRAEGYAVKVPRGAKKEDLASILNAVHKEFERAGRATNSNLEARAQRQEPTVISPAARQIIGDLVARVGKNEEQRKNDAVLTEAYQGGYSGRGKGRRGRVDTAYPVKNNRAEIDAAEDKGQARLDRIARQATGYARGQIVRNPGYNPFAADVTIAGGGQTAGDNRFALKAIKAVVDRLDKLGEAALQAHDDLDKMDARLKKFNSLQARGITDPNLAARVAADKQRRPELEASLREFYKKARQDQVTIPGYTLPNGDKVPSKRTRGLGLKDLPDNFFSRESFGAGFEARKQGRFDLETKAIQRAEAAGDRLQRAQSSKADVVAALREALFGLRNATNSQGQVSTGVMRTGQSTTVKRVDQRRMLPDVFNEELIKRDFPSYKKEDLTAAQQATNKAAAEIKRQRGMEQQNRLLTEQGKAVKFTPEQMAAQGAKVEERLKRLFDAVDKVTGQATVKAEREEARLRAIDPYGNAAKVENKNTRRTKDRDSSVLTSGVVTRAENIIAGGQATRDMPMVMGRLAASLGRDYKTEIKGQSGYEGIAGLKRLLAEALKGPLGAKGAAASSPEVRAAAKAGKQGGFDDDCCTKIVAGLNRIVTTLQSGIKFVSGKGEEQTGAAVGGPRVAGQRRPTGNAATTPEEREARRQRIREEFALGEARGQRRLANARAQESTASTSATLKEAAAAAELASTLKMLDAATLKNIQRLKEQKAAGADAAAQYKTMQEIYRSASLSLRVASPGEGVGRRVERIGGVLSDALGSQVPGRDVRRLGAEAEASFSAGALQAAQAGNRGPLAEALFGGKGFMSRVLNSTGTFLVRNFTAGFVFGITNGLQDIISQALEAEATFIRVSSALEATGRSPGTLRTGLQGISTDYGVNLKDVYTTASGLTGVFGTNEELEQGTRIAAQLESISRGALNSTEAMKALSSVTTAFGDDLSGNDNLQTGIEGLSHVADVLTVIQDRMGVNIEDTVEGVGRLAGQAKQLGFNFEEVAVYVAAVSKLTAQSGQAAGEQLSRIFSQLQSGPGQAALLKNLGPESGIGEALATRDYSTSMDILLEKYNDLEQAEKDQIALALGGARQAAAINALLEQGAKVRDTVKAATDANGQADKRAAEIAETLNNQIKVLKSNFQNLGSVIIRSGLLNSLGLVLFATNKVLGGFNQILSLVNDFADSNPITRWARDIGLGFLGALIAIKLLMVGVKALKATMVATGLTSGRAAAGALLPGGLPAPGAPVGGAPGARPGAGPRFLPYLNPFRGFGTNYNERAVGSGVLQRSTANRMVMGPGGVPVLAPALFTNNGISTRLANGLGVRSSRLASTLSQTGQRMVTTAAPTMAGLARQTAGRALMGPVATGAMQAGRAMTALGSILQRSAIAAAAASAAMSALLLALGAVLIDSMRARQFRKDLKKTIEQDMSGDTEEDRAEEERYSNKYGELVKKNNESLENGFGMGGVRALARGTKNIISALTPFADFNESDAEAVGDFSESKLKDGRNVDQAVFKQMQKSFGRIREINMQSATLREKAKADGTLLDPETQEQLKAYQTQVSEAGNMSKEEIDKLKEEINSSDMSDAQKAGALAYVEDIQEKVAELGAKAILKIKGLNSLNVLGTQQLDQLTSLMASIQSGGSSANEFESLITDMTKDIGLQEGSDYLTNTMGLATDKTQVGRLEKMKANERLNLQMLEAKLADRNLDPQLREDLTKQAQAALGRYEQMTVSVLQAHITGATALANEMAANGDFVGGVAALSAAISAAEAEVERQKDDPYQKAIAEANLRTQQMLGTELGLNPTVIKEGEARSRGRDSVGNAQSETREAREVLKAYEAEGSGATAKQISDARIRLNQALIREADALNSRDQARQQQVIAGTLNAAAKATLEEALALDQVAFARAQFGEASAEYAQAMGRYTQAQEASFQANEAQVAAAAQTSILRIAPNDLVAVSTARRDEAARAVEVARRFGTDSTQFQQATQTLINAQREVNNSVRDVNAANSELAIAIAEAAGDRIAVAQETAKEAERLYQVALKEAGGNTKAAPVVRANAARIRANAGERDAMLNENLATIDFQREIGEISANTAIAMLQELLKQTNLTEEQRRSLRLKIKGLQADIRGQLTASGFNIPDQIKLPTAYEVRRSLGLDDYVAAGQSRLNELGALRDNLAASQMTQQVSAPNPLASLQTLMPQAGTSIVNNTTVNNTVSTPAMVEAVARRVVELISTGINTGNRANQTSPALVRY